VQSLRISSAILLLSLAAACATEDGDSCVADRKLAVNGIGLNKLATNGLAASALLAGGLADGPLTSATVSAAITPEVAADALALDILEYTVSCALGPDQNLEVAVSGGTRSFAGGLGLAPAWGQDGGRCDEHCRGWVSACLVARTNFLGESRQISLLGDNPALMPTAQESARFDVEEATYYGDLFASPAVLYGCTADGQEAPERTCGGAQDGCAITIVGACDEVCDAAGCRGVHGEVFTQAISVNLSDAASCG
jgi:hypothetical protein